LIKKGAQTVTERIERRVIVIEPDVRKHDQLKPLFADEAWEAIFAARPESGLEAAVTLGASHVLLGPTFAELVDWARERLPSTISVRSLAGYAPALLGEDDYDSEARQQLAFRRRLGASIASVVVGKAPGSGLPELALRRTRRLGNRIGLEAVRLQAAELAVTIATTGGAWLESNAVAPQELSEQVTLQRGLRGAQAIATSLRAPTQLMLVVTQLWEHWSGAGPGGLRGEQICAAARVAIAALSATYLVPESPLGEYEAGLQQLSGSTIEPALVKALLAMRQEAEIFRTAISGAVGGRVLIVDPDPRSGAALATHLSLLGLLGEPVTTAEQALDSLDARPSQAIVLELDLPDLDGYTLLAKIRRREELKGVPVICIGLAHELRTVLQALKLGAVDFQPRPINLAHLVGRLRSLIDSGGAREEEDERIWIPAQTLGIKAALELLLENRRDWTLHYRAEEGQASGTLAISDSFLVHAHAWRFAVEYEKLEAFDLLVRLEEGELSLSPGLPEKTSFRASLESLLSMARAGLMVAEVERV